MIHDGRDVNSLISRGLYVGMSLCLNAITVQQDSQGFFLSLFESAVTVYLKQLCPATASTNCRSPYQKSLLVSSMYHHHFTSIT
jgi:hypothetical protein